MAWCNGSSTAGRSTALKEGSSAVAARDTAATSGMRPTGTTEPTQTTFRMDRAPRTSQAWRLPGIGHAVVSRWVPRSSPSASRAGRATSVTRGLSKAPWGLRGDHKFDPDLQARRRSIDGAGTCDLCPNAQADVGTSTPCQQISAISFERSAARTCRTAHRLDVPGMRGSCRSPGRSRSSQAALPSVGLASDHRALQPHPTKRALISQSKRRSSDYLRRRSMLLPSVEHVCLHIVR
jgi:hypothetical protein